MSITTIDIVDHGNIIYDGGVMHIIVAHIDIGDMFPRTENPIASRRTIGVECNANVYPRTYRSPAIVAAVFTPGDPSRRPFISRNPHPPIGIVVEPVAVMEWRPAPTIIGQPGPAVVRIHPVAP
jgi:hypothetical protein